MSISHIPPIVRVPQVQDSPYTITEDPNLGALKGALLKNISRSVYVYRIDCGGCNGCEIEIFASITPLFDAERFGIKVVSSPRHADVLVYTGAVTRSMRVPALRAYHAAPDPKICVAYGACGSGGGIFHDLYCVWGGADKIVPVDLYIPGCPPTPAATIYGFALALGLLGQKLKGSYHLEAEGERAPLTFSHLRVELVVAIEREARRMAGYLHGQKIAEEFLGRVIPDDLDGTEQALTTYLEEKDDPRLAEIVGRLEEVYHAHLTHE